MDRQSNERSFMFPQSVFGEAFIQIERIIKRHFLVPLSQVAVCRILLDQHFKIAIRERISQLITSEQLHSWVLAFVFAGVSMGTLISLMPEIKSC